MAKHIILFVIDGMRPDGLQQAETPNIDWLIAAGACTWQAQTVTPSISLPCHTFMPRLGPAAAVGWQGRAVAEALAS
jgi:predicted AlkP superfamily pyrophosphatase or phosphodiesterase